MQLWSKIKAKFRTFFTSCKHYKRGVRNPRTVFFRARPRTQPLIGLYFWRYADRPTKRLDFRVRITQSFAVKYNIWRLSPGSLIINTASFEVVTETVIRQSTQCLRPLDDDAVIGVAKVDVNRCGNWWCHPFITSKSDDLF